MKQLHNIKELRNPYLIDKMHKDWTIERQFKVKWGKVLWEYKNLCRKMTKLMISFMMNETDYKVFKKLKSCLMSLTDGMEWEVEVVRAQDLVTLQKLEYLYICICVNILFFFKWKECLGRTMDFSQTMKGDFWHFFNNKLKSF